MTLTRFHHAIRKTPINLVDSALLIAQSVAYPALDLDAYRRQIKAIAEDAAVHQVMVGRDRAEKLALYLHETVGLRGNVMAYEDERNSFLNDVLERGLGIPITLSIIYIAIAEQLGLRARGVALPGHFIVCVSGRDGEQYIDPFNGARLTVRECAQRVKETTGYEGSFRPEWLNPADNKTIIMRVLNNLRYIYLQNERWEQAETVLASLRLIDPGEPTYVRDDAIIQFNHGNYYAAAQLLEGYLAQSDDDVDTAMIRVTLGQMLLQWAKLN